MAESTAMNGGPLTEPEPIGKRRAFTLRSLSVGLIISILIVAITPYNDYVVWNSFIVGNYFPPIATLFVFGIVLLINGPLHRYLPRFAFSHGELAVIMAMALVSCSLPSQGLLRQFVPFPVAPIYLAGNDPKYAELLKKMELNPNLFAVESVDKGYQEMSVTKFYSRLAEDEKLPWKLWLKPLWTWGIFAIGFLCCMVSIACLVRFQWVVNERLAFPIAQLQSLLVAPPDKGRALNDTFRSKGFWIAVALVMVIQGSWGLSTYFPKSVPAIPFQYDLTAQLADPPWSYLPEWPKKQTILFTLLGISYFTQLRTSFSLWGTAILIALLKWGFAAQGDTVTVGDAALADQQLGAAFAFFAGVLWIGRQQWLTIVRQTVGLQRPTDAKGAFISYRKAMIGFLIGIGLMFGWMLWMNVAWWVAGLSVLMIIMAHTITARIVAETGLAYLRVPINMDSILKNMPASWMTPRDGFFYGAAHYGYMQSARESALPFTLHALQVIDSSDPTESDRKKTIPVLVSTLAITLIAGTIAALYCYYHWAIPLDPLNNDGVLNVYGTRTWPTDWLMNFPISVNTGNFPAKAHNSWLNIGIGVVVLAILQGLSWRFAGWPLLPVGYLLCTSSTAFYVNNAAFTLFLGWLAKTVSLRVGGAKLFNDLKPFFIGLIFGEAFSTGLWLLVTLERAYMGEPFHVINLLPR